MADLQGIGNMLAGIGAGFSGNAPQYLYAQQQQQEADALKDERRRKALLTDFATGFSLLNNGQTEQATKLFQNRLEMLQKLRAPDMSDTQGIVDRLVSGDPAKIEEVKTGIGSIIQAAMMTGELGGGARDKGYQFGAQETFADPAGNLFMGTMVNDPATGQSVPSVVAVDGSGIKPQGQLKLVNNIGLTAGQIPGQMGATEAARQGAITGAAFQQAMQTAMGANYGKGGAGGEGVSDATLAAERAAAEARAKAEAESKARTVKATQIYTPFSTQLTALRDAYKGTGTGPLVGRFSGYTSSSQKALAARDIMSPMLKQVVRDAGEGTFAKNDQDQIDAMMPKETDLPEVVDYKIGLMDTFVRGKLGVPLDTPSPVNQNANPMEGKTAVNPQTGEKIIMRNGQWVPM